MIAAEDLDEKKKKDEDASSSSSSRVSKQAGSLLNVTYINISSRAEDFKAGLIDTFLNLERIDTNLFLARHLLKGRESLPNVYGGQVIGQSLAAAASTTAEGFNPNSMHSYFLTTGNVTKPILYMVDRVRDGKSFCTRLVKAVQDGEAICTTQISFHKPEADSIAHQHEMPKVTPPEELQDIRSLHQTALENPALPKAIRAIIEYKIKEMPPAFDRVFQIRPVDPEQHLLKKDDPVPRSYFWLKANENCGDDSRLHQCVAAYISDLSLIETAMRPHCQRGFIPSMALTLDHSIWMHSPEFRVDEWMLYENYSSVARSGRSFIEGRLWTRDGRLILSTAQEALVRAHRARSKTPPPPKKINNGEGKKSGTA